MTQEDTEIQLNFGHIDYVGGVYIPSVGDSKTERYIVYFAGGNELTAFNEKPIHDHELSRYYPRAKFVRDWENAVNSLNKK